MFIRAYLRASTKEQDAKRAKSELIAFANDHGHKIAAFYVENESGAILVRPKLMQLIEDAHKGDVILVEQIDHLARLNQADWDTLKLGMTDDNRIIVSHSDSGTELFPVRRFKIFLGCYQDIGSRI